MQVPQLNIHSQKRRNSIFQKQRYSPERDVLKVSRKLEKVSQVNHVVKSNYINRDKKYQYKANYTLPDRDRIIRQVPVPIAIPHPVPIPVTVHEPIIRISPQKHRQRRFSYLPEPALDRSYEQIVQRDLLLTKTLLPHRSLLPDPYLIPSITPLLAPPLIATPLLLPPEPILLQQDVSSFLTSPIIHQAPSTYFQLSQRILSNVVPIPRPSQVLPPILRQRQFSMRNYHRQSPVRDIQSHIKVQNDCHCTNQKSTNYGIGSLNRNVYVKQNQNTINIRDEIGSSSVSFGNNENSKNNNTNININTNNNNNNGKKNPPKNQIDRQSQVELSDEPLPGQILQVFRKILLQQKIQPKQEYPSEWLQIIRECENLSREQRTKLIQQRLKIWKKIRETVTEQTMDVNNSIYEEALRKLQYDNLVFEEKIKGLMNNVDQFEKKTQDIAKFKYREPDLLDLNKFKENYIEVKNEQIHKVDDLIKQAEQRIIPNFETVEVFSYFD